MISFKNITKKNKYRMPSMLRKKGFCTHRFFFTGYEKNTGVSRKFFIEVSQLNPYRSPAETVFGFKSRVTVSEKDLQYALAGTDSVKPIFKEEIVCPSYVVVRAGVYGKSAKQVCSYDNVKNMKVSAAPFSLSVGGCLFDENSLSGKIFCSRDDVFNHPEYFCSAGSAAWSLTYAIKSEGTFTRHGKPYLRWFPAGANVEFSGVMVMDGLEYLVSPDKSAGFIDFCAGKNFPLPLIHISSSDLTSVITGTHLGDSCFAVHGVFGENVSLFMQHEDMSLSFPPKSCSRFASNVWNCTIMSEDDADEKLHWSVSVSNKYWIVDIDCYCLSRDMFVREFELPEGDKKTIKVLCGGNGYGEMKIYKRLKKNIELIEQARIESSLCEYGREEEYESAEE